MNKSNVVIRPIQAQDNLATAAMIRAVFEEFGAEKEGTVYSDPTTDHLYELFTQQKASVFYLALIEGEILGSCGIYPTEGLPIGYAELVKFYLNRKARGQGIGRALMEKCIQDARAMHYKKLYIESLPIFDRAVRIYKQQGFVSLKKPLTTSHPSCDLWFLKDLAS